MDGVIPYDFMLEQISPEHMSCTMDLYWFARANADPFTYIEKHPGRFTQCHIKDMAADGVTQVDPGTGVVDFEGVIALSEKAGFAHYYIEDKRQDKVLERSNNSFRYASKIVRKLNEL
jgi:sugar phosphate isomerase/epimerase